MLAKILMRWLATGEKQALLIDSTIIWVGGGPACFC